MPDDVELAPVPALHEAQRLLDDGLPFHAHDVLEGTWKKAGLEERDLWQGLAQLAVGLTHLRRGNPKGATTLLTQARSRISRYAADPPYRIDVPGLVSWVDVALARLAGPDRDAAIGPPQLQRPAGRSDHDDGQD